MRTAERDRTAVTASKLLLVPAARHTVHAVAAPAEPTRSHDREPVHRPCAGYTPTASTDLPPTLGGSPLTVEGDQHTVVTARRRPRRRLPRRPADTAARRALRTLTGAP